MAERIEEHMIFGIIVTATRFVQEATSHLASYNWATGGWSAEVRTDVVVEVMTGWVAISVPPGTPLQ
jgi:hypothetical protein